MKRLSYDELEGYIRQIDAAKYAKTRNYLGGTTRLSEYLTRGFISLPRTQELVLENNTKSSAFKLLSELSWREYFQHVWRVRDHEIFDYFKPLDHEPRQGIPTAVLEANTGIKALDDGIKQLIDTGYIDNHMRMWLAGLICNVAKCEWQIAADWMHSYLIDGDYASNHLNWQWVAGSFNGSSYLPHQGNINKYTKTDQAGTYLDHTYKEIGDMDVPDELKDITKTLPKHDSKLPKATITLNELQKAKTILLYSPWTLDLHWRTDASGLRVLVLAKEMFTDGAFSQNVIDSIMYFADKVKGMKLIYLSTKELSALKDADIRRKDYPGINDWPGEVDKPELLHPELPLQFYPSYGAYWKAIKKHSS